MSFLSDLEKTLRANHILVILGAIVLVYAVYSYSDQKFVVPYEPLKAEANARAPTNAPIGLSQQAAPVATSGADGFSSVDAMTGQSGGRAAGAANLPVANPSDLLPRDSNNQWGSLNPSGSGDLLGQNLLSATFLTGIDTIGNTMKNANLQLRSEPPNPQLNVGPWNQSTFAPDLMRTPLELGSTPVQ
jgi:hypothetical protein